MSVIRTVLAVLVPALTVAACVADPADAPPADEPATTAAQPITGGDTTPEPLPSPVDIRPLGVFAVGPGARACFGELPANQSAGIGGQFSFTNFVKYPKLIVFHRRDTTQAQTKIFTGDVIPDASGYYQKVFNTANSPGLFPGLFQFCLRNPAANPGFFYSNAQVTTF